MIRVRDGVIETARPGHALRPLLAPLHWQYANEQFAYLAQRVVEHAASRWRATPCAHRLSRLALAGGVVSNVKATRRVRLLPEVEDVYVFPHMGDGGLALGAARAGGGRGWRRRCDSTSSRLDLGPAYDVDGDRARARRRWARRRAGALICRPRSPICSPTGAS